MGIEIPNEQDIKKETSNKYIIIIFEIN